jgi:hypothetical protein
MRPASPSVHDEQAPERQLAVLHPPCPVCTGFLVYLRGGFRCSRCCFTLCEGCEGETADNFGPPE